MLHSLLLLLLLHLPSVIHSKPYSIPHIPTLTSPFHDESYPTLTTKLSQLKNPSKRKPSSPKKIISYGGGNSNPQCPLSFHLGKVVVSSTTSNNFLPIHTTPLSYPIHPASGPGRNILFLNSLEHLDMMTPSSSSSIFSDHKNNIITESISQDTQFPLLFESSNFYHVRPILQDVNGDGIQDVILVDYDGGIFLVGLDYNVDNEKSGGGGGGGGERFLKRLQLPALFLRKSWFEDITNNNTSSKKEEEKGKKEEEWPKEEFKERTYDPYHSYFEYSTEWKEHGAEHLQKLKFGVSGNVLDMDVNVVEGLEKRKKFKWMVMLERSSGSDSEKSQEEGTMMEEEKKEKEEEGQQQQHRRLQEVVAVDGTIKGIIHENEGILDIIDNNHRRLQEMQDMPPEHVGNNNNAEEVRMAGDPQNDQGSPHEEEMIDPLKDQKEKEEEEHEEMYHEHDDEYLYDDIVYWRNAHLEDDDRRRYNDPDGDDMVASELWQKMNKEKKKKDGDGGGENDKNKEKEIKHDDEEEEYHHEDYHDYFHDDYYYSPHRIKQKSYYDNEYYVKVHPHILTTPQYFEVPKKSYSYNQQQQQDSNQYQEMEEYVIFAVSYYYDEDQFDILQSTHKSRGRRIEGKFLHQVDKNNDADSVHDAHEEMKSESGRSMYMSSALVIYDMKSSTWSSTVHLDLSSDYSAPPATPLTSTDNMPNEKRVDMENLPGGGSKMAALVLTTPTVVDLDANGEYEIVVGTSMGLVYILDAQSSSYTITDKTKVPIQMLYPIEQRILVEDVIGNDEKLEMFVLDTGGNVVCLNSDGDLIWHRFVLEGEGEEYDENIMTKKKKVVQGTSPMSLGDVNGDGKLDIVLTVRVATVKNNNDKNKQNQNEKEGEDIEMQIYAFDAQTGDDIKNFPLVANLQSSSSIDVVQMDSIPQPLLVDLHHDQDYWIQRLRRSSQGKSDANDFLTELGEEKMKNRRKTKGVHAHGGTADGLHIVQPIGSTLYFIEGGSGCTQTVQIGDTISTMVQVDDVHGTNKLDLIVTTSSGQIMTMESESVPYHPLNVWNTGDVRSRMNAHSQGYSSMQGIFVHDISRQYRDVLGMFVPVTFEIFDRRPPPSDGKSRKYKVEIRDGTSTKRVLFYKLYDKPGVYTEQVHISYGPGYYTLSVRLTTANGIVYDDVFHFGYNIRHMEGLSWMLFVPLVLATFPLLCYNRKANWDDEDGYGGGENVNGSGRGLGILGR